jgi:hypothetical protein
MKNKNELLSVVLEILSFFLVTIDLYGRERLGRLKSNISNFILSIYQKYSNFSERYEVGVHRIGDQPLGLSILANFMRLIMISILIGWGYLAFHIVSYFLTVVEKHFINLISVTPRMSLAPLILGPFFAGGIQYRTFITNRLHLEQKTEIVRFIMSISLFMGVGVLCYGLVYYITNKITGNFDGYISVKTFILYVLFTILFDIGAKISLSPARRAVVLIVGILIRLPVFVCVIIWIILAPLVFIFTKYKLEGVFLTIGTILFLCSRGPVIGHLLSGATITGEAVSP